MHLGRESRGAFFVTAFAAAALLALVVAASAGAANGLFDRTWGRDVIPGGPDTFEICVAPSVCNGSASGGSTGGELAHPQYAAVDDFDNVYVTDADNHRVVKYSDDGTFQRTWGLDVAASGPGDTGSGFEVCVPADNDVCQAGDAGAGAGGLDDPRGVTVLHIGVFGQAIVVADDSQSRLVRYSTNGTFLRAMGKDVVLSGANETAGDEFEVCVAGEDVCKKGEHGDLAGELYNPVGVASTSNDIFAVDFVNATITRYDGATSQPERVWGKGAIAGGGDGFEICVPPGDTCGSAITTGDAGGEMYNPKGLAADGNGIYVAEWGQHRIQKFTAAGSFIRAWGKDVIDPGVGSGFEVCETAADCKTGVTDNAGVGTGGMNFPSGIATDSAGDVYVGWDEQVQRFSEVGVFQRMWGRNVVASGPDNTASGRREICVAGTDTCKKGETGDQGGEFLEAIGLAGNSDAVYAVDYGWHRVSRFDDVPNSTGGGSGTPVLPAAPAAPAAPAGDTGLRAAALRKCKKKKGKARKKCKKKAQQVPA
jgi:hypothetical protein